MKNLVFSRIFLHCVALGFIVSGLLLRGRPGVRIPFGAPVNNAESLCFQGFSAFLLSSKRKNNQASLGEVFLFYCCKAFFSYRATANSSICFPAESEATSSKRSEDSGKNSDLSQENGPLPCRNSEFCGKMRQ